MSITKVYIPDYELDYLESKPESTAAAYTRQEAIWNDFNCHHEFTDLAAVWHDASEEPKPKKYILCDRLQGGYEVMSWYPMISWEDHCFIRGIKKWAYIDDLYPEGIAEPQKP